MVSNVLDWPKTEADPSAFLLSLRGGGGGLPYTLPLSIITLNWKQSTTQLRAMGHEDVSSFSISLTDSIKWAASSDFVSSSIPSWQILTAHAQSFRGARDLAFCLKVPLDLLLVWASSGGSGEIVQMRRLSWTFAARIGHKYQNRLTRPKWSLLFSNWMLLLFPKDSLFRLLTGPYAYFWKRECKFQIFYAGGVGES